MEAPDDPAVPCQLVLELPHRAALQSEDFLVSASNEAAVTLIDRWPRWSAPATLVVGPAGSGKSHLANVWRLRAGASEVKSDRLGEDAVAALEATGALAIEDLDRGISNERVLFHLINLAREKAASLLLTSRLPAGDLIVALPDLRSRLRALPMVRIATPDDGLLRALLVKLFADRQLVVEPHVIAHLALHMDRSFEAASQLVAHCDRLALSRQRRVTRAIAAEALTVTGRRTADPNGTVDGAATPPSRMTPGDGPHHGP